MLKIYNSLSCSKEFFYSLNKKKINIYVCGPTVYNHLHIGNIRSLVFFHMVKKYFLLLGFQVNLVINITDLDDKIIEIALLNNKTEKQISSEYINSFFVLLTQLEINMIDKLPLATDYINKIITYIELLIQKKYAYLTDQGVYFKVSSIHNYGCLSKQRLSKLKQNVRKTLDSQKENFEDFILWKKTDIGIQYESPWFVGRPGWHTECVVMIKEIFQQTIDIHGGGNDLKFPHHENEQAQFLASENKPLANFFMHVGHVNYQKQKMSKSLHNIVLAKDLLQIFESNVIKLFFCSYHYLKPINYSDSLMKSFQTKYIKMINTLNKNHFQLVIHKINNSKINSLYIEKFHSMMKNDFNTPNIITLIDELFKKISRQNLDLEKLAELQNTLIYLFQCLDMQIILKKITKDLIKSYYLWQNYRRNKAFAKADFYRNILKKEGII
ncbi:MAG: cysteine--tRNA ligase [Weeping tea tree witches'-broom phytoplasma]|uniref:cysteine--tRNA ligase n=1 Tax=Candidatus Phytoplasma melaleucae TaxID=2982630 RepID=UPI002939B752|nr:cysteine--tRNA ligase [Weeping tea tree witches'-broom phytoplasma]